MKTRNWKRYRLAIFMTFCLILYASHCYSWQLSREGFFDPWVGPYYDPFSGGQVYIPWIKPILPRGLSTVQLLQEQFPGLNITIFSFFPEQTEITEFALTYNNYGLLGPANNWNPYQQTDLYVLPASQKHKLYEFTKGLLVPPIMPDIWMGYGGGMSNYVNYGDLGVFDVFSAGSIGSAGVPDAGIMGFGTGSVGVVRLNGNYGASETPSPTPAY